MMQEPQTFPTLRSWRRMSESEQDAMLDRIEARRRWGRMWFRAAVIGLSVLGLAAAGIALAAVL